MTERYRNSVSRVPVLSYIPLLGRLFRNDTKEVDRRELLIFMQPEIISGEESRERAQADTEGRYKATKPLLDFADGGDILPSRNSGSNYSAKGSIPKAAPQRSTKNSNSSSTKPGLRYPTRR